MLTRTIKGIVRGGKIELSEQLDAPEGTEVSVTVPTGGAAPPGKMITFGMFAKPGGRQSTWEDFEEAKKLWEREWEQSWDRLERS